MEEFVFMMKEKDSLKESWFKIEIIRNGRFYKMYVVYVIKRMKGGKGKIWKKKKRRKGKIWEG